MNETYKIECGLVSTLMQDFNKTIGRFHQSVFIPRTTLGLTGTSEGHCVVWENEGEGLLFPFGSTVWHVGWVSSPLRVRR